MSEKLILKKVSRRKHKHKNYPACKELRRPIKHLYQEHQIGYWVLIDFSRTVKAATLIFISGRGSAISSPKEGKSGFIYNMVKK